MERLLPANSREFGEFMRPIKFRSWNKTVNVMNRDVCPCRTASDCILMQFTGLQDKNGKEIWEGDIVEITSHNPYWRAKVEWGGKWGARGFVLTGIKPFANHRVEYSNDSLNETWENNYIKILGNIYENPELLETK